MSAGELSPGHGVVSHDGVLQCSDPVLSLHGVLGLEVKCLVVNSDGEGGVVFIINTNNGSSQPHTPENMTMKII